MVEQTEEINLNNQAARNIFGKQDQHLTTIENEFDVELVARGNIVKVTGEKKNVETVIDLFNDLNEAFNKQGRLTKKEIDYAIELAEKESISINDLYSDVVQVTNSGKKIRPKTIGQKIYLDALRENDIVFCIGPAGTGKTYLAVVMAVNALMSNQVKRIILTRPAIEAGENLGFLPGDLQEKVDPYLRPLYDSLYDVLGNKKVDELLEKEIIEIAPLAYMRGRTLKNSFVILDEAQNTTKEQMKMFLTRLGPNSEAVITGDITQVDLPHRGHSGLAQAEDILKHIDGINFTYLTNRDVVRHKLVKEIIDAYEQEQ
ncbi:PhoH family protein [Halanaerobacter jeridensis]|uniref:PhoH-like protein n=1 Tax=Halanaerobacter jeridensis TaxID=706427 RepID=A0A938XTW8_9FIRM|nr:PhoH family protein [Halanaerobacter jeridensis]MBM7556241.1 phosphate starvation-inducible PhoH-like protein [Halanaerobacter jeridensis]